MPFKLTADGERIRLERAQIQRAMKPRDIFKDIFGLAVRLLGLVFLYFGLNAVPQVLDFGGIETADKGDILNAILPIVFDLLIAWWLIGGGLLIRRAYPETPRFSSHSHAPEEGTASAAKPGQSQGTTDMDAANKKLASLVEKQKDVRTA